MRDIFPGHFRPTPEQLGATWQVCIFAVDANVLLNLYRYSPETRVALEGALKSVEARLFLPHQAAKEFLNRRLSVTAAQAEEYSKAMKKIDELASDLADRKRHPFLPESDIPDFNAQVEKLKKLLDQQRDSLLARLTKDEILDGLEKLFKGRTGGRFDEPALKKLVEEGETRYAAKVPPGYEDKKKEEPYGDLIIWKQLIEEAKSKDKALIFVTDDKKEDWWLEQSGRTIGPRIELREEFVSSGCKDFWMYTVDLFIEEAAKFSKTEVSRQVLDEIKTVRQEVQAERYRSYRQIARAEMLDLIADSEVWAKTKADGFVGVNSFVINYLGNQGFDYATSWNCIHDLVQDGLIELYEHQGTGHQRPVRAVRLARTQPASNTEAMAAAQRQPENTVGDPR